MSTDLDDLIRRDDDLYNFKEAREDAKEEARRPKLASMLDQIAQRPAESETAEEPVDGEVVEEASAEEPDADLVDEEPPPPADDLPGNDAIQETARRGRGRSGGEG